VTGEGRAFESVWLGQSLSPSEFAPGPCMKKVKFVVDGEKVVGVLHTPTNVNPPGIIMVHGFKGDKDEHGRFVKIAQILANNGFCVVNYP